MQTVGVMNECERAKIQTCWRQFVWPRIFILNFFAQNSKVRHIQIIPTQNPSVVQKNYSEKKCSGTLPLSSNSQNIYFARLVIELHTGENSRFSIKRRRNVDILRDPCELDPRFFLSWSIFMEKFTEQKFLSVTSSFLWYKNLLYKPCINQVTWMNMHILQKCVKRRIW